MLSVKDQGRLLQIIGHCERIQEKIADIDVNTFEKDKDICEIVCFNIFQIGELTKGLSDELINKYNKMPWKQIKGMRDRIGHGYATIDYDIVWDTAKNSINELKDYVEIILRDF